MLHFDNLSATIIGGIVLLTVLFMQQRQRDVSIDKVATYAANKHSIELGSWLQEDMTNIGWMTPPSSNGLVTLAANDSIAGLTKLFEFDGLDADSSHKATRIQYQLVPAMAGSEQQFADIHGISMPLWEVRRVVNGAVTGQSIPLITHFNVRLLDQLDNPTTVAAARKVRVQFSMALATDDSFIQQMHWGTTFSIWRL